MQLELSLTTVTEIFLLLSKRTRGIVMLETKMSQMVTRKKDVQQGTLALMVLKTLDVLGPLHGYGLARRIEQISGDLLAVNQGTLYPLLLKLEQEGAIASEWGAVGEQSTGALLPVDRSWTQAAPGRDTKLGADDGGDRPVLRSEGGGRAVKVLRRFLKRLAVSATRQHDEERMREELEAHVAMQTAEYVRAGLSPEEARRQALLKFGSTEAIRASYRDEQGLPALDDFVQDVRYAFRQLRKAPLFALTATMSLALGIGANAAVFTVIERVLLRPLPVSDPHELVYVTDERILTQPSPRFSYPFYTVLRDNNILNGVTARAAVALNATVERSDCESQRRAGLRQLLQRLGGEHADRPTAITGGRPNPGGAPGSGDQRQLLAADVRLRFFRDRTRSAAQRADVHHCGCRGQRLYRNRCGRSDRHLDPDGDAARGRPRSPDRRPHELARDHRPACALG